MKIVINDYLENMNVLSSNLTFDNLKESSIAMIGNLVETAEKIEINNQKNKKNIESSLSDIGGGLENHLKFSATLSATVESIVKAPKHVFDQPPGHLRYMPTQ